MSERHADHCRCWVCIDRENRRTPGDTASWAAIKNALQCMVVWLTAALIGLFIAMSWALDGPGEVDEAKATALNVKDAIHQAKLTAKSATDAKGPR